MNTSFWALGWRTLWRDLRSGELRLLMVAVTLAVAALTAVGFFSDRLQGGLQRDARQLLGSPANADPMHPHDVAPEEIDVATGIWHIEQMTTFQIRRPSHTWAGLRSFVPDGDMVIGWDGQVEGFFWVAAQGGYGIQSAPGYALLARNLALGEPLDAALTAQGVEAAALSPQRIR